MRGLAGRQRCCRFFFLGALCNHLHKGVRSRCGFAPLESISYKLLIAQPFCFHIFALLPGVWGGEPVPELNHYFNFPFSCSARIANRPFFRPLFSYVYTLFHFAYPVSPVFATLTKTTGVGTNNSQNGTSRLLPERNSHESANCYRRQRLHFRPAPLSVSHPQRPSLPHGRL